MIEFINFVVAEQKFMTNGPFHICLFDNKVKQYQKIKNTSNVRFRSYSSFITIGQATGLDQ